MGILQRIRARRPVPFPEEILAGRTPLSSVSLSCIQRAIWKATSLERTFERDIIRPKCIKKLVSGGVGIEWLWLLDGDRYVVTLDTDEIIRCYDMKESEWDSFKLKQQPDCWDFDVDEEGITIVVNGETLKCVLLISSSSVLLSVHPQRPCHGYLSHSDHTSSTGRFHKESTNRRNSSVELS